MKVYACIFECLFLSTENSMTWRKEDPKQISKLSCGN